MRLSPFTRLLQAVCLPATLAALLALPATGQQGALRLAGVFTEVTATGAQLLPASGKPVTIVFAESLTVARLDKATPAEIKPGLFVGVGARPQKDGSQQAVQIVIFPETMRGTGEGHRAWGVMPEATMTNGAIAETVQSVSGPDFTLTYKGGTQKVTTPADASILALRLVSRADLTSGARGQAAVTRRDDGTLTAARVTLWAEGVEPY